VCVQPWCELRQAYCHGSHSVDPVDRVLNDENGVINNQHILTVMGSCSRQSSAALRRLPIHGALDPMTTSLRPSLLKHGQLILLIALQIHEINRVDEWLPWR
jgi:hypothetical protein